MAPKTKRLVRKVAAKERCLQYTHMTDSEKDLLDKWHAEGKTATDVAEALGRDLSVVARHFKRLGEGAELIGAGRPPALSPEDKERIVQTASSMIEAADSEWQVTAAMIREALKLKCCDRVIINALHEHNIYFHDMREKPVRTEQDEIDRKVFGRKFEKKPLIFWSRTIQAYLDNKFFPVYLNAPQRVYARKRRARGSYRAPGQGLAKGHTKPPKNLKQNFGKFVHVAVAISAKKVICCHIVKGNWGGQAAKEMYVKTLGPALRRTYPSKRRFLVLEDNDPTGYKSGAGVEAKKACKIDTMEFPKRSPDLNPLDYAFWSAVNVRLRAQEAHFAEDYKESRNKFEKRVKRTILRVPASVLGPMVSSMQRRCAAVKTANGGNFEE